MLRKNKNKVFAYILFLLFVGVFFGTQANISQAQNASLEEQCKASGGKGLGSISGKCDCPSPLVTGPGEGAVCMTKEAYSSSVVSGAGVNAYDAAAGTAAKGEQMFGRPSGIGGLLYDALKWLLFQILVFVGWLLSIAGALFAWVVQPGTMSGDTGLFNKAAVRDIWIMVRDFANMFFILVLLFSAFATIFQVGKYHISKVWLSVLIYALLVNFSFPIARLVIDIANVIMYFFLNNIFQGAASQSGAMIFANFSNFSALGEILKPEHYMNNDVAYLVAAIVFTFIFGITLLVLAALFVIRLVALSMLIMFSPIGFVGYISPGTSKYASDWWKNLLNYSFFGPVMAFGMAVALKLMETLKTDNMREVIMQAQNNAMKDQSNWIGEAAFFMIPIIVLWGFMGVAKKFSIEGADKILKQANKAANWGKSLVTGGAGMAWRATGIPGGFKQAKDHYGKRGVRVLPFVNRRFFGSDQTAQTSDWVASKFGAPVKPKSANTLAEERAKDIAKTLDFDAIGKEDEVLRNDRFSRATLDNKLALVSGLAEKGKATNAMVDWLSQNHDKIGMAKEVFNKVKEKSPQMAFNHLNHITDPDPVKRAAKIAAEQDKLASKFDVKNLDENITKDEEFMALLTAKDKIGKKELDGMDGPTKTAYEDTIKKLAEKTDPVTGAFTRANITGPAGSDGAKNRSIMLKNLAFTGEVPDALQDDYANNIDRSAQRIEMWKKLTKDYAGGIKDVTINDPLYRMEIIRNVDPKNFKEVVLAMPERLRYTLCQAARNANRRSLNNILSDDALTGYWTP